MRLFANADLQLLVEQPLSRAGLARINAPRGTAVPIEVQFIRNGQIYDPDPTYTSGTITIGYWYKIGTAAGVFTGGGASGGTFTTVGATDSLAGTFFKATATTPTWGTGALKRCATDGTLFSLRWTLKEDGKYNQDPPMASLVGGGVTSALPDFAKFGTTTSTIYRGVVDYNTTVLNTLLGVGTGNGSTQTQLMAELSWEGAEASKAIWVPHYLRNDLYKVGEGNPVNGNPAFVRSLNDLQGVVRLVDSDGNPFETDGQDIIIEGTGGGSGLSQVLALDSGASSASVTFDTPFDPNEPSVFTQVEKADPNDDNIFVVGMSISLTGFVAYFNSQTANANYKLHWSTTEGGQAGGEIGAGNSVSYESQSKTAAEKATARTNIGTVKTSSIAEVLGVPDNGVETVAVTNFQNTGEGFYGATQCFGTTFWNPVRELWYTVVNTGYSAYLFWGKDGVNWGDNALVEQSPRQMLATAAGCDSNGVVFVIVSTGIGDAENTWDLSIRRTNTNGESWTSTPIVTGSGFIAADTIPQYFVGVICQIGDGRMVASYLSNEGASPDTGLFFFDPDDPTDQSNINLGIGVEEELALAYDAVNEVLIGILRTDSALTYAKMLKLFYPWDSPSLTSITSLNPVLFQGNQISVCVLGNQYIASCTVRSQGTEYLFVATAPAAEDWTLYDVGTVGLGASVGHSVSGGGGIASNGTDVFLHMVGAGFGADRNRDAELLCTRYLLAPPVEAPVIRPSDTIRQKRTSIPARPLKDNQISDVQLAKYPVSPGTIWICEGRAVVEFPADAVAGDKMWFIKNTDDLIFVRVTKSYGQTFEGTFTRSGTTVTITLIAHGRSNGDKIWVDTSEDITGLRLSSVAGDYTVGGVTSDTFTVTGLNPGADASIYSVSFRLFAGETIHWTDGVTYTSGTSFQDESGQMREYMLTCLAPREWQVNSPQAESEFKASSEAISADPTATDNLMARLDAMSGRDFYFFKDDFAGGAAVNWVYADKNAGSVDVDHAETGHPGIIKPLTDVNNGDFTGYTDFNRWFVRVTYPWHMEWTFRLPAVTNIYMFLGLEFAAPSFPTDGTATIEDNNVIGIKLDTGAASNPTHFKSITKSTTATETSLGVAVAGDWYRIEMTENPTGTINFRLVHFSGGENVTTSTHSANLSSNVLYKSFWVGNKTNAAKALHVDCVSLAQWGFTER